MEILYKNERTFFKSCAIIASTIASHISNTILFYIQFNIMKAISVMEEEHSLDSDARIFANIPKCFDTGDFVT